MDTKQLKNYAPEARRDFIEAITNRAAIYGLLPDEILPMQESGDVVIIGDQPFPRAVANQRRELETRVAEQGFEQFIEAVAYTWFNRLVAIRYMEVHGYLDHGYRVLSHPAGESLPEVMEYAERLDLPGLDTDKVIEMKLDGQKDGELYRLILVAQCNALHRLMPFMFGSVSDATVLLLPDNLLNTESVVRKLVKGLPAESLEDVESVGWLYQFYISEKKKDVFEALKKKKKKITPDNIPAATQLFTPHWIVRYLVENSLGRLWMLNHPDSKLFQNMKDRGEDCYYIEPEEPETDFLQISRPEEIKICDPACGSGHMLTYAFDLLYAIYEEQGYRATDIPKLIFENNLYGIEIDDRAGALAAFALTMKAREKNRRFLNSDNVVQPNICVLENITIEPDSLDAYMDKVGRDLFSDGLQGVVNQWKEAKNFGSLIRPLVTDVAEVLEQLRVAGVGEDLFLNKTHQRVLKALRQADYLSPKYHVVVANPPYMKGTQMSPSLKKFTEKHYKEGKANLFAVFLEHLPSMTLGDGFFGMINMHGWMFTARYEALRNTLLHSYEFCCVAHLGAHAFDSIGGEVVQTTMFVLANSAPAFRQTVFHRLVDGADEKEKNEALLARRNEYRIPTNEFFGIDGEPMAYWLPKAAREAFSKFSSLGNFAEIRAGMQTGDNDAFLRYWHEVDWGKTGIGFAECDSAQKSGKKWFPYNKGGGFRKWFGLQEYLINWHNDGEELKAKKESDLKAGRITKNNSKCWNQDYYFLKGISWSALTTGSMSARDNGAGFLFDTKGPTIFPSSEAKWNTVLAFLNSRISTYLLEALSPTLDFHGGTVSKLPLPEVDDRAVGRHVAQAMEAAESDWNSSEQSWDFSSSPLLYAENKTETIAQTFDSYVKNQNRRIDMTREAEEQINSTFIAAFDLDCFVDSAVSQTEVTLSEPIYNDMAEEFISYAVGCMLGRYSLDKPGLILANQGETADDYRRIVGRGQSAEASKDDGDSPPTADCLPLTFKPDEDNVIPVLDGDWFDDDISERFKEFLKVTFGEEQYDENLAFLENSLYPDNETARTRKTILDYFTKDFFKQHMKMYKKRPIYWLFSSGKQGAFRAVIYMHRYNPSTLSRMRTAYVVPLQGKYNSRIDQLANDIPAATSTSHRKQLEKEHASFIKKRDELQTFDEKLRHYADQRIEINLDDGVKENYSKFGDLLAEVKAITGKKPVDLTASKKA